MTSARTRDTGAANAGAAVPGATAGRAALVVTALPALLDEVHRLAAGAGVVPVVAGDVPTALRAWSTAGLVLVGADLAEPLARSAPPRRSGVHLLVPAEPGTRELRAGVDLGAESVLDLEQAGAWVGDLLTELADPRSEGHVVALMPASGGAGATTLACALAQVAARAGRSLVVDVDPFGAGADRVLGLEGAAGLRWDTLAATSGRLSGASLRESVPRRDRLGVLTWPPGTTAAPRPEVVRETLEAARRAHDLVVVDLPRMLGPVTEEVVTRCDRLLLVVRPTVAGVAAATRLVTALEGRGSLVLRGHGIPAEVVASAVDVPVLLEMRDQRGVEESVDLGTGPVRSSRGPLAAAAGVLLADLRGAA